ncbi:beta-1,4-galactosyltransferase 3-like isoform X1 [Syngnathus scovelli]|uniref:beta-1,4-galactosyltransferase 3-like isoform X1 n=1 Tax=Syngnathus scovelli TaxID=161590 RepID=UPI00210F59E7|nr:beta-1,4-galactosyltransferase 3-like isoform X1 [Syngnathus scovelli]
MDCYRRLGKWPSGLASLVGLTAAVTLVLRCAFWAAPRPLAGCRAESSLLGERHIKTPPAVGRLVCHRLLCPEQLGQGPSISPRRLPLWKRLERGARRCCRVDSTAPRTAKLSTVSPLWCRIGSERCTSALSCATCTLSCRGSRSTTGSTSWSSKDSNRQTFRRGAKTAVIWAVFQWGDGTFNKGKLLNAGVREVLRDEDWSCIVIHDVDLLAENDRNLYTCDKCNPTHLAVAIDKFHYRLPYRQYFGGVVAVTPDQYRKMNGFSNQYWGWGREDDDLWQRVALAGMKVMRPPLAIARYKMIKHHRDRGNEENPYNFVLRNRTALAWYVDGLNSLTYKLLSKEQEPLYTRLAINVGEKPRPWVQDETTTDKTATSRD